MVRPTEPSFSVAPTTAIDCGWKIASSGWAARGVSAAGSGAEVWGVIGASEVVGRGGTTARSGAPVQVVPFRRAARRGHVAHEAVGRGRFGGTVGPAGPGRVARMASERGGSRLSGDTPLRHRQVAISMSAAAQRASRIHPGWIFAGLDLLASSWPSGSWLVDTLGKIPVPQIGVALAVLLVVLAAAWAVTGRAVIARRALRGRPRRSRVRRVYQVYAQTPATLIPVVVWCAAMLAMLVRTHQVKRIHPGLILAGLDVVGLLIASYLSYVELGGGVPSCGQLHGCETVALSPYARIGGIPVAVFGVCLSLVLLTLAIAWIRTNNPTLLDLHYGLSLIGVIFEVYFITVQVLILHTVCIWCASYGLSLIARFLVALVIWVREGRFQALFGGREAEGAED